MRRESVEALGGEPARAAHALEALRSVKLDDSVLRLDAVVRGDADVLSHAAKIGIATGYGQQDTRRRLWMRRGPLPAHRRADLRQQLSLPPLSAADGRRVGSQRFY